MLCNVLLVLVLTAGLLYLYYALALMADASLCHRHGNSPSAQPPIAPSRFAEYPQIVSTSAVCSSTQRTRLWTTAPAARTVARRHARPAGAPDAADVLLVATILFFIFVVERSLASHEERDVSNSDWRHGNFCRQLGFLLCGGKLAFERGAVVEVSVTNGRVLARKDRSKTGVWYNVVWCDEGRGEDGVRASDGTYTIKYDDDIVDDSGATESCVETWANRDSSGTRFPPSQMPSEKRTFSTRRCCLLPPLSIRRQPKDDAGAWVVELVSHLLWQAVRSLHDQAARAVWWLCAAVTLLFPFPWSAAFLPGFVVRFVYGPWAKLLRGGQLRDVIAQDKVAKKIAEDLRAGEDRSGAAAPWLATAGAS